ncbi:hypothetical protein [Mesorhizobium sp. M0208]|uniref:hypothetical protein n=1 Tax=Mesorhizobium sp. M0208 TaxID=2956916 RepID=UPI00333B6608
MAANERQAAQNMQGCVATDEVTDVVQVDKIGDRLIRVSFVKNGKTLDFWIESALFKHRNDWLMTECRNAGESFSDCLDSVYH